MSYPLDLDEYTTAALRKEIKHREDAIANGKCPYCGRALADKENHKCKFSSPDAQRTMYR